MNKVPFIAFSIIALVSLPAHAGLVNGGVKGVGKGVKATVGCADRGMKGVAKGAKTTVSVPGKAIKKIF